MRNLKKALAAVAIATTSVFALAACDESGNGGSQAIETKIKQSSYDRLTKAQPAVGMNYSPTREIIRFWINTWDEPNKLAYVYLLASNGQMIGYYIFEGPPVNACAALTPNFKVDDDSNDPPILIPQPSVDGVFYSGSQCMTYYGKDASSGAYIEYTAGNGISAMVYSEPLPRQNVEPLGFATVENTRSR